MYYYTTHLFPLTYNMHCSLDPNRCGESPSRSPDEQRKHTVHDLMFQWFRNNDTTDNERDNMKHGISSISKWDVSQEWTKAMPTFRSNSSIRTENAEARQIAQILACCAQPTHAHAAATNKHDCIAAWTESREAFEESFENLIQEHE